MANQSIWQFLHESLRRQEGVALLLVVASKGSSPGAVGAKMAVAADGAVLGTIGGGSVELELGQLAREQLADDADGPAVLLFRRFHDDQHDESSGHLCGGVQQVVLWHCRPADLSMLQTLRDRAMAGQPVVLRLTADGARTDDWKQQSVYPDFDYRDREHWCYRELVGLYKQAYIVGGGHVSLALSRLLSQLDYRVAVFDQRDGLATMNENGYAREKIVVNYRQIDRYIPEGETSYVFVMTHSHETDRLVIARLAGKKFRYLGLMGSQRKITVLKNKLADTIGSGTWDDIHAPLGLPINSRTPMEIAVSIAAELIQFDNGKVY